MLEGCEEIVIKGERRKGEEEKRERGKGERKKSSRRLNCMMNRKKEIKTEAPTGAHSTHADQTVSNSNTPFHFIFAQKQKRKGKGKEEKGMMPQGIGKDLARSSVVRTSLLVSLMDDGWTPMTVWWPQKKWDDSWLSQNKIGRAHV